ncbi:MAG: hypothetical protein JNM17_08195 [Archangium sp.]|nr:hypothetical protein [Archangium sp.]
MTSALLVCVLAAASPDAGDSADAGVAPPFQLHARAMPDKVKIGEPFVLEVALTHDPLQRYELKTPGDLGDFDYLGQERKRADAASPPNGVASGGFAQSTTTISIKLSAFQLGELQTPEGLQLEVTAPEGIVTLPVPRVKVEVVSTLPPDADKKGENLYDVKSPEELAIRSWRLLYVLAAILLGIAIAYGIWKYATRPKPVVPAYVPPPEPLHVRATKALDALAAENLPMKGEFKPYYFRLSEIVRGYLGELYGFEALESTTPELLVALHNRTTPGLPLKEVVQFAEASDFVRYAKQQPTIEDCKLHLELGYRIIHSTQAAQMPSGVVPAPKPSAPKPPGAAS